VARRQSKHLASPRPLLSSHAHAEDKADGRWLVRSMPGDRAVKDYRCPGCDALIRPGTPHVVVWPDAVLPGDQRAVDERRHWHTACWGRRR